MSFRTCLLAAVAALGTASIGFADTAAKVGVYDSRLVAYAHFFQPARQTQLKQLLAEAKKAKAAGDTAHFKEVEKQIVEDQRRLHLQVFSTAPIPETMAQLQHRLPEIKREAGVARLVSKWDVDALRDVAADDRIDVTDLLLRDCVLNDQQRQTMRELAGREPLPLAKARELDAAGKL